MNTSRINEMRQKLKPFRNDVAYKSFQESQDKNLTEMGLCVKYVYELLDMLDTPNDPISPTPPTVTIERAENVGVTEVVERKG